MNYEIHKTKEGTYDIVFMMNQVDGYKIKSFNNEKEARNFLDGINIANHINKEIQDGIIDSCSDKLNDKRYKDSIFYREGHKIYKISQDNSQDDIVH